MSDELKKHRVIGIRHTLKKIKDAGLISEGVQYPVDAVARSDAPVDSIVKTIEETFNLPIGSVKLQYPSGRKARSDTTINHLRKKWDSN
jgi:hypothetical protein